MIHGNIFAIISLILFIVVIMAIFDTGVKRNIVYFAIQSMLVIIFGIVFSIIHHDIYILIASILGFFSKVIIIPQALFFLQKRTKTSRDNVKEIVPAINLAVILGVMVFVYFLTKNIVSDISNYEVTILILGLGTFFLGLYMMVIKNNLIAQITGFLFVENSISILSITFASKLPLIIEIGLLLVVLMAVAIMMTLSLSVNKMFKTLDTQKLTKLKD